MILHVLRQPQTAGVWDAPDAGGWAERVIMPIEGRARETPLALFASLNLLAGAVPRTPPSRLCSHVAGWSGWLPPETRPRQGTFPSGPETWMGEGRARLDDLVEWLAPSLADAGFRLALRPHARHTLNDVPSCLSFIKRWNDAPIDLILDPAAMLTDDMVADAPDHIARIAKALGGHERVIAIVAANVRRVPTGPHRVELAEAPVHRGPIDPMSVLEPIVACGRPVILIEQELPKQLGLIRPAGLPTPGGAYS
ncbi:MAG: hypothetical protein H6811_09475 [Phycisphaeraceae bacterium]|nr:hypothetical protein [Phycisphaeraceae bacterium]